MIKNEDYITLKREIHTLKGLGGSIGFDEVTEISLNIDTLFKDEKIEEGISQIPNLIAKLNEIAEKN